MMYFLSLQKPHLGYGVWLGIGSFLWINSPLFSPSGVILNFNTFVLYQTLSYGPDIGSRLKEILCHLVLSWPFSNSCGNVIYLVGCFFNTLSYSMLTDCSFLRCQSFKPTRLKNWLPSQIYASRFLLSMLFLCALIPLRWNAYRISGRQILLLWIKRIGRIVWKPKLDICYRDKLCCFTYVPFMCWFVPCQLVVSWYIYYLSVILFFLIKSCFALHKEVMRSSPTE